jgi:Xaa-Pro aminopeptidase
MDALMKAIRASDMAIDSVAPTLRPGMTERDVAWRLEQAMREHGADAESFPTIVAAGPNAALPHHRASDQPIREGEPIVIDMGARVDGYCSDLTRTFFLGAPDETFIRIYDTVHAAQLTAIGALQSGMTGEEADRLARDLIEEAGYGENFGHALGHGIGLAVHEMPRVGRRSQDRLEDGMVFTIEPGIYVSAWGGVRIEDVVILEGGRARVLSRAGKRESTGAGG